MPRNVRQVHLETMNKAISSNMTGENFVVSRTDKDKAGSVAFTKGSSKTKQSKDRLFR